MVCPENKDCSPPVCTNAHTDAHIHTETHTYTIVFLKTTKPLENAEVAHAH